MLRGWCLVMFLSERGVYFTMVLSGILTVIVVLKNRQDSEEFPKKVDNHTDGSEAPGIHAGASLWNLVNATSHRQPRDH